MKFKDFQAPASFSRTFKALNLGEKKFKYFQGLSRMRENSKYYIPNQLLSRGFQKWVLDSHSTPFLCSDSHFYLHLHSHQKQNISAVTVRRGKLEQIKSIVMLCGYLCTILFVVSL